MLIALSVVRRHAFSFLLPILCLVQIAANCSAASVTVQSFGAKGDGLTDNTVAFRQAITSGSQSIYVPCGVYYISGLVSLANTHSLHFFGAGACSVLVASSSFEANSNFLDVSGATNLELDHLAFDMKLVASRPTYSVIGGVPTSGSYGPLSIHDLSIYNNAWQGIAVGTSGVGATLTSLNISSNTILMNRCVPNLCGNAIDTGSLGRRVNVVINANLIIYPPNSDAGSVAGGVGIFCGHGYSSGFTITNNVIQNSPTNAITVFARPFNTSDSSVVATNYTIQNNTIGSPARACVALVGASKALVGQTHCVDPGETGISLSFGTTMNGSVSTNFSSSSITLDHNEIVTGENGSNVQNCVYLSGDGSSNSSANSPSGNFQYNTCAGSTGTPVGADQGVNSAGIQSGTWR